MPRTEKQRRMWPSKQSFSSNTWWCHAAMPWNFPGFSWSNRQRVSESVQLPDWHFKSDKQTTKIMSIEPSTKNVEMEILPCKQRSWRSSSIGGRKKTLQPTYQLGSFIKTKQPAYVPIGPASRGVGVISVGLWPIWVTQPGKLTKNYWTWP